MNLLFLNIFLAAGFMILLEIFTIKSLMVGFLVGFGALWLTRPLYSDHRYFMRVVNIIRLIIFFIKALFVSNLRVLWDVVTPFTYQPSRNYSPAA